MEDKEPLFNDEFNDVVEDSSKTDIDDITDNTEEANAVIEKVEQNEKEKEDAPDDVVEDDESETDAESTDNKDDMGNVESDTEENTGRDSSDEIPEEVKTESTFFYTEDTSIVDDIEHEVIVNDTYLGDTEILTIKDDVTLESVPLDRNTRDTVTLNNPTGVLQYLVLGQEPIEEYTRQLEYVDREFNNIVESIEQWFTAERLGRYFELSDSLVVPIPPSSEFEDGPVHLPDAVALQYFQMIRTKVKVQYQQSILSSIVIDTDKLPKEVVDVLTWITYLITGDVIDSYISSLTDVETPNNTSKLNV